MECREDSGLRIRSVLVDDEPSQNMDPFELSATPEHGPPRQVTAKFPDPLTNDTCHGWIFKELHSTVQERSVLSSSPPVLVRGQLIEHRSQLIIVLNTPSVTTLVNGPEI